MTEIILRDYQVIDIAGLRDLYRQSARAPIYQLSTGGGKTVVFSHVIKGAVAKAKRTLVLAHRRELIRQASNKLADLGVAHGIMAAGQDRDHDALVIVASIQTVARRLDQLPKFDLIVIDEAHHAVSATFTALLASQPQAKLLGVTATPQRLDGKGLGKQHGGHFDAILCGPSMESLIEQGYLAKCRVLVPAVTINVEGIRKIAGDYDEGELEERAQGVTGDAIKEFAKLPAGTTAIAFCVTVKHATDVAEAFVDAGYAAQAVHGGMREVDRDDAINGLFTGKVQVLTACEIISEGLDVPSVGCVILLRPTQSLTMCRQQIGRGMRPKADGSALVVLDHARNCITHGLPTEPIEWSLDGAPKKEVGPKAKPEPWRCIACDTLNAAQRPACEHCGAAKPWHCRECRTANHAEALTCVACGADTPRRKPLVLDDGAMAELTADSQAAAKWRNMPLWRFAKIYRSDAEVEAYRRAKGYKGGWAWHFRQEQAQRMGVAPIV